MKNKKKKLILLLMIICVILLVISGYYFLKKDNNLNDIKVVSQIKDYKYKLTNNKTPLYKKYFLELRDILGAEEINDEQYAKQVVKLFVSDFYDLNSKVSKTNVGGLEFIHPGAIDNFKLNAQNTMYKYIENNVYNNRQQELPKIKSVVIDSAETTELEVNNRGYIGYKINATWEYEKDLGYEQAAIFYLIKPAKYYYIIKTD